MGSLSPALEAKEQGAQEEVWLWDGEAAGDSAEQGPNRLWKGRFQVQLCHHGLLRPWASISPPQAPADKGFANGYLGASSSSVPMGSVFY